MPACSAPGHVRNGGAGRRRPDRVRTGPVMIWGAGKSVTAADRPTDSTRPSPTSRISRPGLGLGCRLGCLGTLSRPAAPGAGGGRGVPVPPHHIGVAALAPRQEIEGQPGCKWQRRLQTQPPQPLLSMLSPTAWPRAPGRAGYLVRGLMSPETRRGEVTARSSSQRQQSQWGGLGKGGPPCLKCALHFARPNFFSDH